MQINQDTNQKGIWRYSALLEPVDESFRLSLGEGNTEEVNFDENIILKREDKNPTGSLKDRGMAYLISRALNSGYQNLVISSSGNAAISALTYCKLKNLNLQIFVSKKTNTAKMQKILELGGKLNVTERAVSDAAKYAKENDYFNLRPSINESGSEGYKTIAFELLKNNEVIEDIFIPVSSGVCLLGIFKGFSQFNKFPRFHLCQSSANPPLASIYDNDFVPEEKSLASSLVAKSLPLKEEIISVIEKSGGTGWVIDNDKISEAHNELTNKGIDTSFEGALALAGIFKAKEKGWTIGKTVCLLTGKKY